MTDIIERAEAWLDSWKAFGDWPVVSDLVAELKAARAENQRLLADAEMWRGMQSMYRAMDKR